MPEGKRLLEELNRWEDNIKMKVKKIWCERMDWIHMAQNTTSGKVL
jgi:hypothetical protein